MKMHNPPHPGEILREAVVSGGEITVSDFARRLGVSRIAALRRAMGAVA
jgi:plasmid maintenance system antidote protein VapI